MTSNGDKGRTQVEVYVRKPQFSTIEAITDAFEAKIGLDPTTLAYGSRLQFGWNSMETQPQGANDFENCRELGVAIR